MSPLYDVYAEGPLPRVKPYDRYQRSVLNTAEYGEDVQREQLLHALLVGLPRPLSLAEKWAAMDDPGRPPRVYAPASARVPKRPLPWDAELLEAGRTHIITEESARHPGDRSDPSELR
jgi:hypothetical protein